MLPLGIHFPELCKRPLTFNWSSFPGATSYHLFVDLVSGIPAPGDRVTIVSDTFTGTSVQLSGLPANELLHYYVLPEPWLAHLDDVVGEGFPTASCPGSDPDFPNVVETLANAGFNIAIIKHPTHPQPFINRREAASGIPHFEFIIDARHGSSLDQFTEQLFESNAQGGQGYAYRPDILGWQIDDEPLTLNAVDVNQDGICDASILDAELARLQQKYAAYAGLTPQVVYHIEGSPTYFEGPPHNCSDPGGKWDASVQLGEAASHDHYITLSGNPLTSVSPIATSVARQTDLNTELFTSGTRELVPSWFTVQAFSSGNGDFRTPSETRATVYTALVHGATGFFYFMLDSHVARSSGLVGIHPSPMPASYPEQDAGGVIANAESMAEGTVLWNTVSSLNSELALLAPFILSPTSSVQYKVFADSPSAQVRTMLKSTPDGQYLFAVNMSSTPRDVEFQFPGEMSISTATTFTIAGGGQPTAESGSYVRDTLPGFAAKVYRIGYTATGGDWDGDGCSNQAELGVAPTSGGYRDPYHAWDFYDAAAPVNGVAVPGQKDGNVDLSNDVFAVALAFGTSSGQQGYLQALDRGVRLPDGDAWDVKAPDGTIDLVNDIFGVADQFGHSCA